MESFKELYEGISQILYHYTNLHALDNILSNNKFRLSSFVGTSSEMDHAKGGKYFYLSTTRHKLGGYNLSPSDSGVMLVLDGRKLSQRYSGNPIDYWGADWNIGKPEQKEAEDRIYHDKLYIEKASTYIKEIHILQNEREKTPDMFTKLSWDKDSDGRPIPPSDYVPDKYPQPNRTDQYISKNLKSVWKQAIQKKIPIYFYISSQDFLLQNKKKSIKLDLSLMKKMDDFSSYDVKRKNPFAEYEEMYYKNNINNLSKDARKIVDAFKSDYGFRIDEMLTTLKNTLHNYKNSDNISKILSIFKREKISSAEEFFDLMKNKWK